MTDQNEEQQQAPQPGPSAKERISESLKDWGFDVGTFETRAKASMSEARGGLDEIAGAVRQTLSEAKDTLVAMQKTTAPVTSELKSGFERAWQEIEQAFGRARDKMKEQKAAAAEGREEGMPEEEVAPVDSAAGDEQPPSPS